MMILPLLLIMIIPKIMNDPETRKVSKYFNYTYNYINLLYNDEKYIIKIYVNIIYFEFIF